MAPSTSASPHNVYTSRTHPRLNQRLVSLFSVSPRHPLNVKPNGNQLLLQTPENNEALRSQMGSFYDFPDELLMEVLSYVTDVQSLKNLSHTSRVMYAYLYDEELWKKVHIRQVLALERSGAEPPSLSWRGSWRSSVLNVTKSADIQISGLTLCSDVLYRPFQCSQIDYKKLFQKVIKEEEMYSFDSSKCARVQVPTGRVMRISETSLSVDEYNKDFSDKPFILTNLDPSRWPRWDLSALLERFGRVSFRQEAVQWPLDLYAEYLKENKDESPLYLFDCKSAAMRTLRNEYKSAEVFGQDFFMAFNEAISTNNPEEKSSCRPDYAWLIIGSERSGSTFHKDPNYTSAWNTALTGRKLWIMLPPDITPPGVGTDATESEVTAPVGIAEWVLSGFYNDCVKIEECRIAITFPGECMHVPLGWWHAVINLDDSVALTQNFVPQAKLSSALNFLKNRREQVSGFRPNEVKAAIDRVLAHEMEEAESIADDIEVLRSYAQQYESLELERHLQDEDCGEIGNGLPPMPVFELFRVLLTLSGNKQHLAIAIKELEKIEKAERTVGPSEAWQKLTETAAAFSFGFEESDDEDN